MRNGAEDPTEDRRDELRRIIFGVPGEAPEDVLAEFAALELELAERREPDAKAATSDATAHQAIGGSDTSPRGADDESEVPEWDPDAAPGAAAPLRVPRRRPLIGALTALAALALIMVGVAVIGPMRESLAPPRGLDVFERDRTAEERELADQVATAARLGPDDVTTLRSVGRVFGYTFWVHRDGEEVCLLSQRPFWFEWVRTCADLDEFREEGLTRRIVGDDIRSEVRPRRIRPDDIVLVTWGPRSIEVEWEVLPAS